MLSAQGLTEQAYTTVALANPLGTASPATGSASPPSAAYTPAEIESVYDFDQVAFAGGTIQGNGAGQTIALIDAYNDPDIQADLTTFDSAFGITAPPTFTVEGQTGSTTQLPSTPTPGSNNDWSLEISLDVEWAHALAPDAKILLVESNSSSLTDLFAAVSTAANTPGVDVISMSFGASEFNGEASDDSIFTTPSGHLGGAATTGGTELAGGITFVSSAGDAGSPGGYPAYSPNVLSVGGTTLNPNPNAPPTYLAPSGTYSSETVWDNSSSSATGGGISVYEPEPSYQDSVVPSSDSDVNNVAYRAMPDVSFDANPNTGVAVVNSFDYGSGAGWVQVGGTSLGAPSWAAIIAIADQGRAIDGIGSLNGATQTLPDIYSMPSNAFHDITGGSNGTYSATVGYDLVTGRGTPIVSSIVGYLSPFAVLSTSPANGSTQYGATQPQYPTSFTVTFSQPYSTSGITASDFEVNGVAATSFTETSSTSITFSFSSSPVISGQLAQTMTIAAGGLDQASNNSPLVAFSGAFYEDPLAQLAVVSTTPASTSVVETQLAPLTSLTVDFNEAYATSSISKSNLTLSEGTVTGYTLVNSTTVTYSLSGLPSTSELTVSIAAGAVTDPDGGAIAAFTATYALSSAIIGSPGGSLVYETEMNGNITNHRGSTTTYTYTAAIAAGQTITAVVVPGTLQGAQLSVVGPGIVNQDTITGSGSQEFVLQTVPVTGGSYTFTVSAPSNNTGSFTLEVFLNAAVSTSGIGGASNNQFSEAQSITGFETIGPTATRAAVVGKTGVYNSSELSDYYSFTLAAGQTVTLAVADQSGAAGMINVALLNSNDGTLANGTPLDTNVDGAIENFTATAAGTYYAEVTGDAADITYLLNVTVGADFDLQANGSQAAAQNITGTAGVLGSIVASAPTQWYAVNLAAGTSLSLQTYTFGGTVANQEQFVDLAQPQIQFYSPTGTLLASGTGSTNQSLVATASASGTYYIEVTGGGGTTGEYFLSTSVAPSVSVTPIAPNPTNTAVSQLQIVFNGPVAGMSLADLSLSLNGGPNLLTANQTLTTTNDTSFTLGNLGSLTAANGVYALSVAANSGITNQNGLALQTGASTTFTVDSDPPEVAGVYVSGTAWTQTFLSYLASHGLGSAQLGYLIPSGSSQLQDIPWVNVNTISVVFNESVSVNAADSALELIGSPDLPPPAALSTATFSYNAATNTAQWTFASPLATDKYLLSIPSADVTDSLGSTLDGEWTNGSSAYPSGNGVAGGIFNFQFNILQGNVTRDGGVTGLDGNTVRLALLQNTTTSGYSPFDDLIGSGTITGVDGTYVRLNLEQTLPADNPVAPAAQLGDGSGDAVASTSGDGASSDLASPAVSPQFLTVVSDSAIDQLVLEPPAPIPAADDSPPATCPSAGTSPAAATTQPSSDSANLPTATSSATAALPTATFTTTTSTVATSTVATSAGPTPTALASTAATWTPSTSTPATSLERNIGPVPLVSTPLAERIPGEPEDGFAAAAVVDFAGPPREFITTGAPTWASDVAGPMAEPHGDSSIEDGGSDAADSGKLIQDDAGGDPQGMPSGDSNGGLQNDADFDPNAAARASVDRRSTVDTRAADDSAADDLLTDLVLEQEIDWLRGG
ncbi:MAG TPA: pre-peptidase C-terminal domain-containing protein [Pirellulales bacterium]|jgi:hypothetical protein|nr:pre-peptidase C-terminal domain-containing protein [Pirellulales bacterium]